MTTETQAAVISVILPLSSTYEPRRMEPWKGVSALARVPETDTGQWDPASMDRHLSSLLGRSAPLNPWGFCEGETLTYGTPQPPQDEAVQTTSPETPRVTLANTWRDHDLLRVVGREDNAGDGLAIVSFATEVDPTRSPQSLMENPRVRQVINTALWEAGIPASVSSERFVSGEAIKGSAEALAPSSSTDALESAEVVLTLNPAGSEVMVEHFARVHLVLCAMRQRRCIAWMEAELKKVRTQNVKHKEGQADGRHVPEDPGPRPLVWQGLLTHEALARLAHLGSAASSFRAELWFETVPRWPAGQKFLTQVQDRDALRTRLDHVDSTIRSWSAALQVEASLKQWQSAEQEGAWKTRMEIILAGFAGTGTVLAAAPLFIDAGKDNSQSPSVVLLALVMGCLLAAGLILMGRKRSKDDVVFVGTRPTTSTAHPAHPLARSKGSHIDTMTIDLIETPGPAVQPDSQRHPRTGRRRTVRQP